MFGKVKVKSCLQSDLYQLLNISHDELRLCNVLQGVRGDNSIIEVDCGEQHDRVLAVGILDNSIHEYCYALHKAIFHSKHHKYIFHTSNSIYRLKSGD